MLGKITNWSALYWRYSNPTLSNVSSSSLVAYVAIKLLIDVFYYLFSRLLLSFWCVQIQVALDCPSCMFHCMVVSLFCSRLLCIVFVLLGCSLPNPLLLWLVWWFLWCTQHLQEVAPSISFIFWIWGWFISFFGGGCGQSGCCRGGCLHIQIHSVGWWCVL